MTQLLSEAARYEEADESCMKALALARLADSRRYESLMLLFSAELHLRLADVAQARIDLEKALALSQQAGMGFIGAVIYGRMARIAVCGEERIQFLAKGEHELKHTGLAHNHLWFYRDAIESNLAAGEFGAALRYADAFEKVFEAAPLPWADLLIERARAVTAASTGTDVAIAARLRQVRATAEAAGVGWALPRIDAALGEG